jgi:hypothetical protein
MLIWNIIKEVLFEIYEWIFFWREFHFEESLKSIDNERILCCDVHVMNIIQFFFVQFNVVFCYKKNKT